MTASMRSLKKKTGKRFINLRFSFRFEAEK